LQGNCKTILDFWQIIKRPRELSVFRHSGSFVENDAFRSSVARWYCQLVGSRGSERLMKVKIAYIEEPPFGWKEAGHSATGADIELAETVLRAIGVTQVAYHLTTFAELLPGIENARRDINVPLFVTPQRVVRMDFSLPVRAIRDGFLVQAGNPMKLNSYDSVARCDDARLGIIVGQVQHQAAQSAGPLARNKSAHRSSVSDNKTVMSLTVWRNVEIAY
jgi:hypothetical protein